MLKRKHVLITTSSFPIFANDTQRRFVLDLAEALCDHVQVSVLAPDAPAARQEETIGRVRVVRFPYFFPRSHQVLAYGQGMPDNLQRSWLARFQGSYFVPVQAMAIRDFVRRHKVDLINSHWLVPQGLAASLLRAGGLATKHVVSMHAADIHFLKNIPAGARVAKFVDRHCDAMFSSSQNLADDYVALTGRPRGIHVQPMGVNKKMFVPTSGATEPLGQFGSGYLLFVGRFVEKKGLSVLIEAFARLAPRYPDLGLCLVGDGPLKQQISERCQNLGLAHRVVFAGEKTHDAIAPLMASCRALVVPSVVTSRGHTEGTPTVLAEGMAAGALIVASRVAGIPEVIKDNDNGFLFEPGSAQALAARLSHVLNAEPSNIAERRASALRAAERYSWQSVAQKYAEVFTTVLAAR